MSTTNSLTLTLGYKGTDFTRKYKLDGIENSALDNIKANIMNYNADIPAADKQIFISDDYDDSDPNNIIGTFESIVAASYETVEYTRINLN